MQHCNGPIPLTLPTMHNLLQGVFPIEKIQELDLLPLEQVHAMSLPLDFVLFHQYMFPHFVLAFCFNVFDNLGNNFSFNMGLANNVFIMFVSICFDIAQFCLYIGELMKNTIHNLTCTYFAYYNLLMSIPFFFNTNYFSLFMKYYFSPIKWCIDIINIQPNFLFFSRYSTQPLILWLLMLTMIFQFIFCC